MWKWEITTLIKNKFIQSDSSALLTRCTTLEYWAERQCWKSSQFQLLTFLFGIKIHSMTTSFMFSVLHNVFIIYLFKENLKSCDSTRRVCCGISDAFLKPVLKKDLRLSLCFWGALLRKETLDNVKLKLQAVQNIDFQIAWKPSSRSACRPHLGLHHGRPLGTERLHGLEEVDHAFVPHPLQHDAEGDENSSPAYASTVKHTQKHIFIELILHLPQDTRAPLLLWSCAQLIICPLALSYQKVCILQFCLRYSPLPINVFFKKRGGGLWISWLTFSTLWDNFIQIACFLSE